MLDTMNSYQDEGMSKRKAAVKGVGDRQQLVLTTSITTIIDLVPLALSKATWMPLYGEAIIFSLVAATLIALIVVPCLYLLLPPKTKIDY